MKFISWNVNGLRACMKKGFLDFYQERRPDFLCLQETKMEQGQADVPLGEGLLEYWNSAEKKGYSGTAVFTPHTPISVAYGMDKDLHDHEGRLITLEYEGFYLVCCYTPNSQDGLKRLDYRMEWEDDLRDYLSSLDRRKPVIYCGDLNVAHQEIDLKNPKTNRMNEGFSDQEREKMTILLSSPALLTRSDSSIPTPPGPTPGGPIGSMPGRTTRDGVSTTLSYPTACGIRSAGRRFSLT